MDGRGNGGWGWGWRRGALWGALFGALAIVGCDGGGGGPAGRLTPAATAQMRATASVTVEVISTASVGGTATAAASANAAATAGATADVTPAARAVVVRRGTTSRNAIALTFDAGSDSGHTREILTALREANVRASFSVTGAWAEEYPDDLLAIAADGHRLINHSYSHRSFSGFSTGEPPQTSQERTLELSRTETTVYRFTSRTTRPFFRPPYGDIDDAMLTDVAAAGYPYIVMWTTDTLGWRDATAAEIVARVLEQAVPGGIVVMHVGRDSQDGAALPAMIAGLRDRGYSFETIDEIIE